MPNIINRDLALDKKTDFARWSNPKAFEAEWNQRAEIAARYIPAGAKVIDLGCGAMALRTHLPYGCSYTGCDLVARDGETIVCDFNSGEFPSDAASASDMIVMLGLLEYIADVEAFFAHLARCGREVLMSYCAKELTAKVDRPGLGWVNNLAIADLVALFQHNCTVAVISYNDVGNFGDRLGYHIINSLLPPHAQVHHITMRTLQKAHERYDLVVLGIGNSLFEPLLVDDLFRIVENSRAAIGIFGTQYREQISRPRLDRLVDRLDTWFARYEDDVLLFGRGKKNVTHVGDWLITQFPMAAATEDATLLINDEILKPLPLDRTIQKIQRYKTVNSSRLHPLLCALTSAQKVAYTEQRLKDGLESGKFRSMLIDVFGRTFPEAKYFNVDREAVRRYKMRAAEGVSRIKNRIGDIVKQLPATGP